MTCDFGGYKPIKITCLFSGLSFEFLNVYKCANFLNLQPCKVDKIINYSLKRNQFGERYEAKIKKRGVFMFKIEKI